MTKNIITIDLPPHLADYCRHEFGVDNEGNIILRRSHDIGKQIYSHILTSDLPRKQLPGLHPTLFIIPVTKSNRYILGSRFLYISRWGEEKIQDYIESDFNQRMRILFEAGYRKNYSQKQIIEAILQAYNIKNTSLNYEAVKKSDYRNQKKIRRLVFDDLQSIVNISVFLPEKQVKTLRKNNKLSRCEIFLLSPPSAWPCSGTVSYPLTRYPG